METFAEHYESMRRTILRCMPGADMELRRPLSYPREALCALAGPGVSLALAWLGHMLPGGALYYTMNALINGDVCRSLGGHWPWRKSWRRWDWIPTPF